MRIPGVTSRPRSRRLLLAAALVFAAGFLLTFGIALHTAFGLHADAELYRRVSGNHLSSVHRAGGRVLATIDAGSVAAGALVLGFLALARGRVARAAAAVGLVVVSVGTVELLKHGLPHVPGAEPATRPPTFPSGHTAVAVSLGLALVLAAPPLLRPTAALVGAAYAASIGLSVVALGWHAPSDAVGSFFVCGFYACLAGVLVRAEPRRRTLTAPRALIAAAAVVLGLVVAAVLAGRHPAAVAAVTSRRSLVATGVLVGLLSLATFAVLAPLLEERER